jgi:hypothetical protein
VLFRSLGELQARPKRGRLSILAGTISCRSSAFFPVALDSILTSLLPRNNISVPLQIRTRAPHKFWPLPPTVVKSNSTYLPELDSRLCGTLRPPCKPCASPQLHNRWLAQKTPRPDLRRATSCAPFPHDPSIMTTQGASPSRVWGLPFHAQIICPPISLIKCRAGASRSHAHITSCWKYGVRIA